MEAACDHHLLLDVGTSVSPLRNAGLRVVLEAAPIGVYVCMAGTELAWASTKAKLDAGPPGQQVTGNGWRDNVHPADRGAPPRQRICER